MVAKSIRTATDALFLNLSLNIPSELPCSFSTPLFGLCYRLHVDFCLGAPASSSASPGKTGPTGTATDSAVSQGAGAFADAFTFSIPIQVLQPEQHRAVEEQVPTVSVQATISGKHSTGSDMGACERIAPSRSSVVSIQQQALRCLESDFVVTPLRVL